MTNVEILKDSGYYEDVKSCVSTCNSETVEDYGVDKCINDMTRREILDMYLVYHGIIGYTDEIIGLVAQLLCYDETNESVSEIAECDFDCMPNGECV